MAIDRMTAEQLTDAIRKLYRKCEYDLLKEIVQSIKRGLHPDIVRWEMNSLANGRTLGKKATAIISATGKQAIKYFSDFLIVKEGKPAESALNGLLLNVISQKQKRASELAVVGQKINLMNTTMLDSTLKAYRGFSQKIDKAYEIMNKTAIKGATGMLRIQDAARQAITELNANGITAFVDRAGHNWTPEAYVNMDLQTTAIQAGREMVAADMDMLGLDIVEVSTKPNARPKCEVWQGKLISLSGKSGVIKDLHGNEHPYYSIYDTSYGEPDGLFGINCHHTYRAVEEGMFVLRDRPVQQEYENTQKQRQIERQFRSAERKYQLQETMQKGSGDESKVANIYEKYQNFCDTHELRTDEERLKVY